MPQLALSRLLAFALLCGVLLQTRAADIIIDERFAWQGVGEAGVIWRQREHSASVDEAYQSYRSYLDHGRQSGWQTGAEVLQSPPTPLGQAWVAFSLRNANASNADVLLRNSFHGNQENRVYVFRAGELVDQTRFGLSVPHDSYRVNHRHFLMPLRLAPDERLDVLIWHSNSPRNAMFETAVASADFLATYTDQLDLGYWLVRGAFIILSIGCLVIWTSTQQAHYLYFAGFLLLSDMANFVFSGYAQQLLWPDSVWLSSRALALFQVAALWCLFAFNNHFLRLYKHARRVYHGNYAGAVLMVLILLAVTALPASASLPLLIAALALMCVVMAITWVTAAVLMRAGVARGRDYFFIWSFYLLGMAGVIAMRITTPDLLDAADFLSQMVQVGVGAGLMAALIRDFTELRWRSAAALAESRTRGEFLAKMSHEIRTPLNGVMGMAEMLKDTPLNALQHSYLRTLQRSGQNLVEVINDILDFSKLQSGRMNLEPEPFSLPQLLQEVADNFSYRLRDSRVALLCNYDFELPEWLLGDSLRLRQVLLNLVSNALKFTPQGEVVIDVRRGAQERLRISVRDTGIGIERRQLALLFKAFAQADVSTTRLYGGTGLGLAICKQLVEMMGGEIGAESEPGRGSTFWVELPLIAAEQPDTQQDWQPVLEKLSASRLLFVDDNATSRSIFRSWLNQHGIHGDICADGPSLLKAARDAAEVSAPYGIVVLDLHLPGDLDGLDLARAIREIPGYERAVLILLTATGFPPSKATLVEAGIDYAATMPVVTSGLLSIFRNALKLAPPTTLTLEHQVPNNRPLHVLIAEDNPVNAVVLGGILKQLGHSSRHAANGRIALEMLRHADPPFDLVLMDCEMPELDGYEACRQIRAHLDKQLPVIAVTAHVLPGEHNRCYAAGMNGVVIKPVSSQDLAKTLAALEQR